jgi:hypothetical protein
MEIPRDAEAASFEKTRRRLQRLVSLGQVPEITGSGTRAVEAWFLGP